MATQGFIARSMITLANGDLLAGGCLDTNRYQDNSVRLVVDRYDSSGHLVWNSWGGEGTAHVVLEAPDSRFLIGGNFNAMLGKYRDGTARLLPGGQLDQCYGF